MRIRWNGGKAPLLIARAVVLLALFGLLVYVVLWGVDLGKRISAASSSTPKPSLETTLAATQSELTRLQAEHEQTLQALAAKTKAEQGHGAELKRVQGEIARLNADLDSLAAHLPVEKGKNAIHLLQASVAGPKHIAYRFFVTLGNKKALPEVELGITTPSGVLKFPGCALKSAQVARCEGRLELADVRGVSTLEARLLEKGQVRVTQTANVYNE